MTDLADVALAQNKTNILLRAFLKIFLVYFVASLAIGIAVAGYLHSTLSALSGCTLSDPTGGCSSGNLPQFYELIIAIVGIGAVVLTLVISSRALNETAPEEPKI